MRLLTSSLIACLLIVGCQTKNHYLIQEAYYEGNYIKTVQLLNSFVTMPRYTKKVTQFLAHSEKRLSQKLIEKSTYYMSKSPFKGLCYLHALLPTLSQLQKTTQSDTFNTCYNTLKHHYDTQLPLFLSQEKQLGQSNFTDQKFFKAIVHFKRFLHFQKDSHIQDQLTQSIKKAQTHLTLFPFKTTANSPETIFGINVKKQTFFQFKDLLNSTPIEFVVLLENDSSAFRNRLSHQLSGTLSITYKDTQSFPELVTLSDTLRYQHDVGGIPQWDDYDFEYTVERFEFLVNFIGHFTLTHPNQSQSQFKITTNYGSASEYRKDTLNLPHDAYRIEFPVRYNKLLDTPILIDEKEVVNQGIEFFIHELHKELGYQFNKVASADLPYTCEFSTSTTVP